MSDMAEADQVTPKLEVLDELHQENPTLNEPSEIHFNLTDLNSKDEFRAIIREMELEWEKADR